MLKVPGATQARVIAGTLDECGYKPWVIADWLNATPGVFKSDYSHWTEEDVLALLGDPPPAPNESGASDA